MFCHSVNKIQWHFENYLRNLKEIRKFFLSLKEMMITFWELWRKIVVNHISKICRSFDSIYNIILLTRKDCTWMYSTRYNVLRTVAYQWRHVLQVASKLASLLSCSSLAVDELSKSDSGWTLRWTWMRHTICDEWKVCEQLRQP